MKIVSNAAIPSKVQTYCFHVHLPCGQWYKNVNKNHFIDKKPPKFFLHNGVPVQIFIKRKVYSNT